jgi:hypothetical protein
MTRTVLLLSLAVALAPAAAAHAQTAPAPAPPAAPTLSASLDPDTAKPTVVVAFGTQVTLSGDLKEADGKPLKGAEVAVSSRALVTGAEDQPAGTLTTDHEGRFELPLPKGPSRRLTLTYRRTAGDAEPAAVAKATLLVRAGVRVRATPSALHNGQLLRLRVELIGRPLPAAGKFVDLQVRRAGKWLTFASVRVRNGRLTYSYRFRNTVRKRTLLFRVQVPAFSTYPYVRGVSKPARVTVRPRRR